jgi:hypothetical protein
MAAIDPIYVACREGETATVVAAAAIDVGLAVGYNGAIVTSATVPVYGVCKYPAAAAGDRITVVTSNETVLKVGGTVAVGAALTAGTGGKFISTTTTGNQIFARALETATADGQYIRALIVRAGVV